MLKYKHLISDHPKMYVRYMDDIFAVFDDDNACLSFLDVLSNQLKNVSYTIAKSKNTVYCKF